MVPPTLLRRFALVPLVVLIAALCGLCTLLVVGVSVSAPDSGGPQNYGGGAMIPLALLLGGVPTVFGCLMICWPHRR